jgi:DnaK suppressor protein
MPLTTDQLAHLERRLVEERELLLGPLREFVDADSEFEADEPAGDLSKMPLHPADLGTATQNQELEATLATRRSSELAEIDAALERLTASPDTFGFDEQTGDAIPFERLDVIPWARVNVTAAPAAHTGE